MRGEMAANGDIHTTTLLVRGYIDDKGQPKVGVFADEEMR